MKKIVSLIKASMTSGMNIFKIRTKGKALPILLALYLMLMIGTGTYGILEQLSKVNLEYVALSLFAVGVSLLALIEGIYKSGSLMFNCTDDQLLLSLPIKRRTILFIRVFKFYLFELVFSSIFLLPLIILYLKYATNVLSFLLTSIVMLLFLPIIPIIASCIIGFIITGVSSKFKHKNLFQIIFTVPILLGVFYLSIYSDRLLDNIVDNAEMVNNTIINLYYPARVFADLAVNFNILKLLEFILINSGLFTLGIYILGKVYFKINNKTKMVHTSTIHKINGYKVNSQIKALIKKEFYTFINTPVLVINAGFSILLYVVIAIAMVIKYDSVMKTINYLISMNLLANSLSPYILLLIITVSLTTSITSSMISLEGKNFNILKSLPTSSVKILQSKLYTSLLIMIPAIIIGNIIIFTKFQLSIGEYLLILIASFIFPFLSSIIGLIINIKYPKLDAENSAEVVKQSISSFVSVAIGVAGMIIFYFIITVLISIGFNSMLVMFINILIGLILDIILYIYLINSGVKKFNKINR